MGYFKEVGATHYSDEGIVSANFLMEADLLGKDEMTSLNMELNHYAKDMSPFMWLHGGIKLGSNAYSYKELDGDGQYYWEVTGDDKQHEEIIGHSYTTGDLPGMNLAEFTINLKSGFMKQGWFIRFKDGYQARVQTCLDKGTHWEYILAPYTTDGGACSLENLEPGNLVRAGVYAVGKRFDVGTEGNRQTNAKRTNQINTLRHSYPITGSISTKKVKYYVFKESNGGDGKSKYWIDDDFQRQTAIQEQKVERFLFEDAMYNRDENGVIVHTDNRSGGEPVATGASIKQFIEAEGNFATYGNSFTMDMWERTIGDITYGTSGKLSLMAYCGSKYMEDFSSAIQTEVTKRGFVEKEGDLRVTKMKSGLSYSQIDFRQYTSRDNTRITLVHLPFLDDPGVTEQALHPRTGKPMSSHSAYYIGEGIDGASKPSISLLAEAGQAKVTGIYSGLTTLPKSWGGGVGQAIKNIATTRNEASFEERRTIGVHLQDPQYAFHHKSVIN